MKNGFIYEVMRFLVKIFYYTNLVEGFKYILGKFNKKEEKKFRSIGIDIFIVAKWLFLMLLWFYKVDSTWAIIIISYLIWTNLFTYFYYHVWKENGIIDAHRKRRRFINLILAYTFSIFAFAFLFEIGFSDCFSIIKEIKGEPSYLLYSIYNSLFANYDVISPINNIGYILSGVQLSITFIFISIILTNSIPE